MRPSFEPDSPVLCESCGVRIEYFRGMVYADVLALAAETDDDELDTFMLCENCNPPEHFDEGELYRQFFGEY